MDEILDRLERVNQSPKKAAFGLLITLLLSTGCSEIIYTCLGRPDIRLDVVNAEHGTPEREGAFATATQGNSVTEFEAPSDEGAREMWAFVPSIGRYTIEVSKEGFRTWVDTNVLVTESQCGSEATSVDVALEASGAGDGV